MNYRDVSHKGKLIYYSSRHPVLVRLRFTLFKQKKGCSPNIRNYKTTISYWTKFWWVSRCKNWSIFWNAFSRYRLLENLVLPIVLSEGFFIVRKDLFKIVMLNKDCHQKWQMKKPPLTKLYTIFLFTKKIRPFRLHKCLHYLYVTVSIWTYCI